MVILSSTFLLIWSFCHHLLPLYDCFDFPLCYCPVADLAPYFTVLLIYATAPIEILGRYTSVSGVTIEVIDTQ